MDASRAVAWQSGGQRGLCMPATAPPRFLAPARTSDCGRGPDPPARSMSGQAECPGNQFSRGVSCRCRRTASGRMPSESLQELGQPLVEGTFLRRAARVRGRHLNHHGVGAVRGSGRIGGRPARPRLGPGQDVDMIGRRDRERLDQSAANARRHRQPKLLRLAAVERDADQRHELRRPGAMAPPRLARAGRLFAARAGPADRDDDRTPVGAAACRAASGLRAGRRQP